MPRGNRRKSTSADVLPDGSGQSLAGGQFIEALARGLRLLQCFRAADERGLGNKELAARSGLSAPTVSRLCFTLQRLGYLVYDGETGRYAMGPAVLELSYVMLRNIDLRQIARPLLREFAEQTGITVAVNTRDRQRMVVLEGVPGTSPVALRLDVGFRLPIISTAAGRAYLAGLKLAVASKASGGSEEFGVSGVSGASATLAEIEAADRAAWQLNRSGIERACKEVKARGFCIEQGGWQSEVHGVAVPLMLRAAGGQLSLSCGGSVQEMPVKRMEKDLGPMLINLAQEIARRVPH